MTQVLTQIQPVSPGKLFATEHEPSTMNPEKSDRKHTNSQPIIRERSENTIRDESDREGYDGIHHGPASHIGQGHDVSDTRLSSPLHRQFHDGGESSSFGRTSPQHGSEVGIKTAKKETAERPMRVEEMPSSSSLSQETESQLSFPQKLMKLLDDDKCPDIVEWLPDGKGFRIHDTKRFETDVMPLCFGQRAKFASFARRLNRWNFSRTSRGETAGAYFHPAFRRGEPDLCQMIKPGVSGVGKAKETDRIDPIVAWNIATPAMLHHGLIDHGMFFSDPSSDPFEPRPIHPLLDIKSLCASSQPPSTLDEQTPSTQIVAKAEKTSLSLDPSPRMIPQQIHYLQAMHQISHISEQPSDQEQAHGSAEHGIFHPILSGNVSEHQFPNHGPHGSSNDLMQPLALDEGALNPEISDLDHYPTLTSKTVEFPSVATSPFPPPVSSTTNSSFSDVVEPFTRGQSDRTSPTNDDLLDMYLQQIREEHQTSNQESPDYQSNTHHGKG